MMHDVDKSADGPSDRTVNSRGDKQPFVNVFRRGKVGAGNWRFRGQVDVLNSIAIWGPFLVGKTR
eukprot:6211279-Pleurochrysis_carterae.AAC.4